MKPCEVPQQEMDLPEQGVVSQPVPSVAWSSGDAGCEAYTGSAKPCDRAPGGMAPAGLGSPPAFLGRPRVTTTPFRIQKRESKNQKTGALAQGTGL